MQGIVAKMIMREMLKNKPKRTRYVPRDYAAARAQANKTSMTVPLPRGAVRAATERGWWYEHPKADRSKAVMLIHGGGFNTGSAEYYNVMVRHLCGDTAFSVFAVEYRLAPENPYPAALCGISPVGEVDGSMPSRLARVDRAPIICGDFTEEMKVTYVKEHDPKDPYLSPIYGDFTGLPPIWMCVGTEEVFYDDAFALRDAARRAGVPAELLVGEGLCHVYPMLPDPQSAKAVKSMRAFIGRCFRKED